MSKFNLTFFKKLYWLGNYLAFYNAIRHAYPAIQIISNCDASAKPLNHPADLYDYHVNILSLISLKKNNNLNNSKFHFFNKCT
jgi:alpha-N-arabinofuranosidase